MQIHQFEDTNLAHFSYAILSEGEIALVDPARDPQPYYDYAKQNHAKIRAVIETHPHADFVSSHLEIHQTTGAIIYTSRISGALYPHIGFDEGNELSLGNTRLVAINTPGHSPDGISILAYDEDGVEKAVFTGDTLFIGDCGRPDLRENAGAVSVQRQDLALQMYHSLRKKLMVLSENVLVYPAHGAGSLCGKNLSAEKSSTIGVEKIKNWSLQELSEKDFVNRLLEDQPFIPKYFPFNVALNRSGAGSFASAVAGIRDTKLADANRLEDLPIIDTRPARQFKKGYLKGAINLAVDRAFETWLGSIIAPDEKFYLIGENEQVLDQLTMRIPKIGYEQQVAGLITGDFGIEKMEAFDGSLLRRKDNLFTIVDVRNQAEVRARETFQDSLKIPLHELRERLDEIPTHKPIVVHCAGGYRSAAGSSIISSALAGRAQVFDLGEAVKSF